MIANLDGDDVPTFAPPYCQWNRDNFTVSLIPFGNRLIWELFSKEFPTSFRLPLETGTELKFNRCRANTINLYNSHIIRKDAKISKTDIVNFLKHFKITKIEKTEFNIPSKIILLPISKHSQIERIKVSKFNWGVVMCTDGRGINGNHAVLIIEGLNENNDYFMHFLDFDGAKVNSYNINPQDFKYEERTEMWVVPSDAVRNLLKYIENEKKSGIVPKFEITGVNSLFSKGHNCCTYLRELLMKFLNINLPVHAFSFIATWTKDYTRKEDFYKNKTMESLL